MKSTEGIIEKILSDASARAKEITDKAELDKVACEKVTEQWIEDFFNEQRKALKKEADQIVERKLTLSKLDKRKIALAAKQEIIGEILDKVLIKLQKLEKRKYLAFIIRLLEQNAENGDQIVFSCDKVLCEQDLIGQEIVAKKNLTFFKREGDFIGGIMLVGKVCDKDLSFGALVEEHQESIVEKITAELFN